MTSNIGRNTLAVLFLGGLLAGCSDGSDNRGEQEDIPGTEPFPCELP